MNKDKKLKLYDPLVGLTFYMWLNAIVIVTSNWELWTHVRSYLW
jgi:hypothetical protein